MLRKNNKKDTLDIEKVNEGVVFIFFINIKDAKHKRTIHLNLLEYF